MMYSSVKSASWDVYDPHHRMIETQKKHIARLELTEQNLRMREERAREIIERGAWTVLVKALIPSDPSVTAQNNELYKAWQSFISTSMLINRGPVETPCVNKLVRG